MSEGPGLDDLLPNLSADELSFEIIQLANVAQRGNELALAGGSFCALWGFLLAATNFYQSAAWSHYVPLMPIALIQAGLGYGGTLLLAWWEKKTRLFFTWRSQVISALWVMSAGLIWVFLTGVILANKADSVTVNTFLAAVFSLNFAAMSTARGCKWLLLAAIGWILCAFVTFFLKDEAYISLAFGTAGFLCMFIPGLILRWREKREA